MKDRNGHAAWSLTCNMDTDTYPVPRTEIWSKDMNMVHGYRYGPWTWTMGTGTHTIDIDMHHAPWTRTWPIDMGYEQWTGTLFRTKKTEIVNVVM
jgi:hypothetical protein